MNFILKYLILIIFVFGFTLLDAVKFRCDYRYTNVGWFKYHEIPATWSDARLQCHFEGGILASPTTAEIKHFMLESLFEPAIFTGIHATFSKGQYQTIDGIRLSEVPHEWVDSEPDNKNNTESCITLNSAGKFADVGCDKPHPYICFRVKSNVDVTTCGTTDPEYHYYNETNKCYKFHTTSRQFSRAAFACYAEGGNLAIINSETEARVISAVFSKYPHSRIPGTCYKDCAFIGFNNWGEGADWTTMHGQTLKSAGYTKFDSGQPSNSTTWFPSGENCGSVFRNGLLNDAPCEQYLAFICEKRPDYPAVCDSADARNEYYVYLAQN